MLGTVLQHYPDGIVVLNSFSRIVLINTAGMELLDAAGGCPKLGGTFPYHIDPEKPAEIHLSRIQDLSKLVLGMTASIISYDGEQFVLVAIKDITDEIRSRERLKSEAITDDLTGLCNRKGFASLAEHQLIVAQREQIFVSLIYFDLDGLKIINDTLGHGEGDHAIRAFSDLLTQSFRKSDIVARLGGDEFAVLVVSNQASAAYSALFRLHNNIAQYNQDSAKGYALSASHGCSFFDRLSPETLSNLIASADAQMYLNKRSNKKALQLVESTSSSDAVQLHRAS